jgi:hypothetical protein
MHKQLQRMAAQSAIEPLRLLKWIMIKGCLVSEMVILLCLIVAMMDSDAQAQLKPKYITAAT